MHLNTSDRERGLYDKFRVERVDGSSAEGGRHYGCPYFVLDIRHDPYAAPALEAYADACARRYPALAADLYQMAADYHATSAAEAEAMGYDESVKFHEESERRLEQKRSAQPD